eukprot:jgi/Chlat1/6389/Chrsp44S05760
MVRASMAGAPSGGSEGWEEAAVVEYPLRNERDPYRRLGVGEDASSEEVQDARNYLVREYAMHRPSVEAVEQAFDRIISQRLRSRQKSKLSDRSKRDKEGATGPAWAERFQKMLDKPSKQIIFQRTFLYIFLAVWSLMQAAASGPAFQVAVAFFLCVYFIHLKTGSKDLLRAFGFGFGALVAGWLVGTLIPVYIPAIFPPALSPETICALFSFVTLWATATFLK